MHTIIARLALISLLLFSGAAAADATTFTFQSNDSYTNGNADMRDLEHGYFYGWSVANQQARDLGGELAKGSVITSATLVYKNIYNWTHETNDQLNSFLLSAPPPVPGRSETVPVVIDGVPQGKIIYTYSRTLTKLSSSTATSNGYVWDGKPKNGSGKYTLVKVSTKTNTTGVPPAGYALRGSTFKADLVTLGAGIPLSGNLWERSDQQSLTDIDWGVESYRIRDIDNDPLNPWHDTVGGYSRNFDLTYNLDEDSINKLFEYALDGSFGLGIDPDCHYYNSGIFLTVETAPVPTPEPSTFMLLGGALVGLAFWRRRDQ